MRTRNATRPRGAARVAHHMRAILAAAVLCLLTARASHATDARDARSRASCGLAPADSAWITSAMTGWRRVSVTAGTPPTRCPILVFFDSLCAHRLDPVTAAPAARSSFTVAGQSFALASAEHGGM